MESFLEALGFGDWWKSSTGPQLSKTISSTLIAMIPAINLFLSALGYHAITLPANLDSWVSLLVLGYLGIQILVGYARSKKVAIEKMEALKSMGNISQADFVRVTKI